MLTVLDRYHRRLPLVLGVFALMSVAILMGWDVFPRFFPPRAHDVLGALPLALIAFAYLAQQTVFRPGHRESVKAILLAVAFLFWAANQLWPDLPQATVFNDIAIALFVLDVFLVLIGWPSSPPGRPTPADPAPSEW